MPTSDTPRRRYLRSCLASVLSHTTLPDGTVVTFVEGENSTQHFPRGSYRAGAQNLLAREGSKVEDGTLVALIRIDFQITGTEMPDDKAGEIEHAIEYALETAPRPAKLDNSSETVTVQRYERTDIAPSFVRERREQSVLLAVTLHFTRHRKRPF